MQSGAEGPVRILIIGYGVLGGAVLDNLSKSGRNYELVLAGRDQDAVLRRANLARYAAVNLGCSPSISEIKIDLGNIPATTDAISKIAPDIILNATSILPWWSLHQLPKDVRERLDSAGGGAFAPTDAPLAYQLMRAVSLWDKSAHIINGSYADAINPALAKVNLAPDTGIGNVANAVPGLRLAVAFLRNCPVNDVEVRFVAHHFVSYTMPSTGSTAGAPFRLGISIRGEDISNELDPIDLFTLVASRFRRVKGLAGQAVTASSATSLIRALADNTNQLCHAPGPLGLPGGYPVRVNSNGVRLDLPPAVNEADAVSTNIKAGRWDGIESIDEQGVIHFTENAQAILSEVLGFVCPAMPITECEGWGAELLLRYQELQRRLGASDAGR